MLDRLMDLAGQHADILLALSLFSLISVGVTMTLGVRLIARLPADYFVNDIRREGSLTRYPLIVRIVIPVLKNLLGFVFILAGVLMLVLPGQGLLTLFAGLLPAWRACLIPPALQLKSN